MVMGSDAAGSAHAAVLGEEVIVVFFYNPYEFGCAFVAVTIRLRIELSQKGWKKIFVFV